MTSRSGPIRVCMVTPKAYPLFNPQVEGIFGGAEVDVYFLATELAKDPAFELSVIVADYGQSRVEFREGVRLIKSLDLRRGKVEGMVRLWRAFSEVSADVYLIKTLSLGVPWLALFCKVRRKVFMFRTSSDSQYDRAFRKKHPVQGLAFDWALRQARAVLAQSVKAASDLRQDVGLTSVRVIPNGHRLAPLQVLPREYVLWVGRSNRMKRPDLFIDLAAAFPDERFMMVCRKATGDKDFAALVERARAVPNLLFIHRVPFHQIDEWFRKAKVFVNTSDSEGFPNTFIQAASQAVPILSLNADPDGFLKQYGCGLCAEGSFARLTEGLRFLLDRDRFVEAGRRARQYVERTHDIRSIAATYKQILRDLTGCNEFVFEKAG